MISHASLLSSLSLSLLVFSVVLPLDWIATAYSSLASVPLSSIIAIFVIWITVSFPLTLVGTLLGRNVEKKVYILLIIIT